VEYPYKHAWLILAREPLEGKDQALRDFIWGLEEQPKTLKLKAKLSPIEPESKTIEKTFYEVVLRKDLAKTAYIYIDFPSHTVKGRTC